MKKFFTFVAAALVSVAMFASREVVPSDADLAAYATKTYTMCIYNDGACNDIVLIGTYVAWSTSADLLKFQAVAGFEGWYVVSWDDESGEDVRKGFGVQAKPVQLDGTGAFSWNYQLGPDAEKIPGRGTADLNPGNNGTEVDIQNIEAGILVIDVKSWKNDPCTAVYHVYNVTLVSPDCNDEDFITPAISGDFNNWAQEAMVMNELKTAERQNKNLPGAVFEISFRGAEDSEYKFRSSEEWGAEWTNQLIEYVAEDDNWKAFNDGNNFKLGEETNLVYDLGDPTKYSWNNCEKPEPVDSTKYYTVIWLNAPANGPEAVEIIGTFDDWKGTAMELLENGMYFVKFEEVMGFQEFKFRSGVGATPDEKWANEIVYAASGEGLPNMKFEDYWEDDTYKGTPCKKIELDLSGEDYVWKANWTEGIENIVLTEKAQKVAIDGAIYIIRDNKMFNIHGAQVR